MSENIQKTHYRRVYKSDHLGCADLEDLQEQKSSMVFTISHVIQERGAKVAGKRIDANIAYFVDKIKPLVLNATNAKVMKKLTNSSFVEDWAGTVIKLLIDPNVTMMGDVVGGVRISPTPVQIQQGQEKPWVAPGHEWWPRIVAAYKTNGDLSKILERANITMDNQQLIINQAASNV